VHLISVPRTKAPELLWARFAAAVGFDPANCDLTSARDNASLGAAETEFLRRMNQALPSEVPAWFYVRELKQVLARGVLSARQQSSRPTLPGRQQLWAAEQAELLISSLRATGFDVIGDLTELQPPREVPDGQADTGGEAADAASRTSVSLEQQLDAAAVASAALGLRCYQALYPAPRQRAGFRGSRQLAADLKWKALNGRLVRRVLRRASRRPAIRRLRILIWSVLMRPARSAGPPAGGGRAQPAAGAQPSRLPARLRAGRTRVPMPRSAPDPLADAIDSGSASQASAASGPQQRA